MLFCQVIYHLVTQPNESEGVRSRPRGTQHVVVRDGDREWRESWRYSWRQAYSQKWACDLLLEEVLEGLAGVVVARRGRRGGVSPLLCVGGWRGIFFHGGTKFVEGAVVLGVLGRDALWDRLRALKLRAAVEEAALFATVQLESAFGTLAVGVKATGEHCAAIGAAGAGHGADHARRSRAELVGARTALRRLAVMRAFLFVLLFRVAITAVTILSIHKPSYNLPTR